MILFSDADGSQLWFKGQLDDSPGSHHLSGRLFQEHNYKPHSYFVRDNSVSYKSERIKVNESVWFDMQAPLAGATWVAGLPGI